MTLRRFLCCLGVLIGTLAPVVGAARPADFAVPADTAAAALLAISRQGRVEILFSHDELRAVPTPAVTGTLEPEQAIRQLLRHSGFTVRRSLLGKFVVVRATAPTGALTGRVLRPDGRPADNAVVVLAEPTFRARTDAAGAFGFEDIPPGVYRLLAGGEGFLPQERLEVEVRANATRELDPIHLASAHEVTELEPYVVQERNDRLLIGEGVGAPPRRAAGNLDLPRTEDNALPFTIFTREQIARSGVVQLNEFFQRELLDSNAAGPNEHVAQSFETGSGNLSLRGYESDTTVVLVNGRRLPESFTGSTGQLGAPDVNLVPLSLVQQVQVLPVSASALYSGNAVGGVINIVLRPDHDGTEVSATYTNALGGFNAPQGTVSLQHGETLLGGKLKLRLNATFTQTEPALESELRHQGRRLARDVGLQARATPNVASANDTSLFGPGTATFGSVAPGATGTEGLAAFAGRAGLWSVGLFDTPGGLAASFNSSDFPYGREQRRSSWFGSVVYDVLPRLQLGLDATYAHTVLHRGFDVYARTLQLPATSAFNPFGQDVNVALNEFPARLGGDYNEARVETYSVVGGVLLRLPGKWQVSADGQYSRNVAHYRGLIRADGARWQELVNAGGYNPLRDPQVSFAPDAFYDRVLVYYGGPGRFVTLGDYETFEGTLRVTNEALPLPMGDGTFNIGGDYRLSRLAPYTAEPRFADGTPAPEIIEWTGRTLERMSVFGEVQAPLIPAARLPRGISAVETDTAVRYIISAQSNETNIAPTFGLKVNFAHGFSFRGSYTTSNRFPTAQMSRPLAAGSGGGSGSDATIITDPRRQEQYEVESRFAVNPNVRPESAATQSVGLSWMGGKRHRLRATIDFADTRKTNEFIILTAQGVVNLENLFPDRIERTTSAPGNPPRITTVLIGPANAARRHSRNWSASADYTWHDFAGGQLELRGRWVGFQSYERQLVPGGTVVDELSAPDGTASDLLRHRVTLGAACVRRDYTVGVEAHYLAPRVLPVAEQAVQGSDRIGSYWQVDAYVQSEISRWWQRRPERLRLTVQARVNNISNWAFPKYVNEVSGAGVQPYGDWRGRTFSLSVNAEY